MARAPTEVRFLNMKQVMVRYGKSERTIHRWVEDGTLPLPEKNHGKLYWRSDELDEYDQRRQLQYLVGKYRRANQEP